MRLRVEGVGTRASGPGQGPSDDQSPSSQATAQVEEQSTSQSVDQGTGPPAEQQQVETEPFPGSSSLDWQSGLLGLRDRAQGRALHNIVAAVGKQFRPVSAFIFFP